MLARTTLNLLVSLAALANARAQELVADKAIDIELSASAPLLEGHGPSRTFEYDVTFDGTLYVWAASKDFDPILRITDSDGELLAEDDDAGGGTTACIELEVSRNELPTITVAAADAGASGSVLLHVSEGPWSTAPDLTVERALIERASAALEVGDYGTARASAAGAVTQLLARPPGERNTRWLSLLRRAGQSAYLAQDARTALVAWQHVLDVAARTLPDDHVDLLRAREYLGGALYMLGDHAAARTLMEKAHDVCTRTRPDDHMDLQRARQNLAGTMLALGDLAGARTLYEKALEVCSRTLPDEHPDLQIARGNLAKTLHLLGDVASARVLYEKVLEVESRTLPDFDPELQASRENLAVALLMQGDLAAARALSEKVLEVRTRTLPVDHPDLQSARQQLAQTLSYLGDLAGARALEEKALETRSRTLPDGHGDLQASRERVATMVAKEIARAGLATAGEEQRMRCAELIDALCRAGIHAARDAILESSGREAEERCSSLAMELDTSISFAQGLGVFEPLRELEAPSFVLAETTRAAAIASAELARRAARAPRYAALRDELRASSVELARLAQQGTTSGEFDRARVKREALERQLVALARELSGGGAGVAEFNVDALAARLAAGEAAVGFRRYEESRIVVLDQLDSTGAPAVREVCPMHLCAFVVRSSNTTPDEDATPTSRLTLVDLGPIEPIQAAARAWREAIGVGLERGAAAVSRENAGTKQDGDALRRLVLDPLLPALGSVQRVVVVLDDVLHLVPLDALPLAAAEQDARLVGDRWRIETRATLSEVLTDAPAQVGTALVALCGASFNSSPIGLTDDETARIEQAVPRDERGAGRDAESLRDTAWERGFPPLTHTADEGRGIGALYGEVYSGARPALVLEQRKASREALIELAPRARFVHIATHGWFAPESVASWNDAQPLDRQSGLGRRASGTEQVQGMSPMLLCGLALAGANLPEDELGRVPGLVTAEELSTLDLSNCELAVLSACDTNVGIRRAGQGVASLQKALQMAGARSVITSLWKVPDEATKELMLDFYRRMWVEKKPKAQALWEAKLKLRNAKDAEGRPLYSTRDWAAWVLTGDPR